MDKLTRAQRSKLMSKVRSKGNRTTELKLRALMVAAGISGWTMQRRDILGNPDFVFADQKIAVFIDGCFWHGCKKCRTIPVNNHEFWVERIEGNKKRDRRINRVLRRDKWIVVRFWEHDLREHSKWVIEQIKDILTQVKGSRP